MTDLYAALGRSQLKRLDDFIERRQRVAKQYSDLFENSSNGILAQDPKGMSSWHLFVTLIDQPSQRKSIFDKLRQEGILVNVHYRPIYRQSFYAEMAKYNPSDFPGAEFYYARAISLPIFPGLPKESVPLIFSHLEGQPGYQNIF
jgi:dTDP-4-amino-4,6-dideoxygalactose transaminase